MAKRFKRFKELEIGKKEMTCVLLKDIVEKETKTGNTFVTFSISDQKVTDEDGTVHVPETVEAMKWNSTKDSITENVKIGDLIAVQLRAKLYNGNRSYEVVKYGYAPESADINDFISASPESPDALFDEILETCKQTDQEGDTSPLSALVEALYKENEDAIKLSGAAKRVHHNYVGGLLYHTVRMVRHAKSMVDVYPFLHADLLVCGAALHDIGKIREMETTAVNVDYTTDGALFSHIVMGYDMVKEAAKDGDYDAEKIRMLLHMILSHHGKQEYGSPVVPAIPEALALHQIDAMDAQMEQIERLEDNLEPGELGEKAFFLNNATPYKPDYK